MQRQLRDLQRMHTDFRLTDLLDVKSTPGTPPPGCIPISDGNGNFIVQAASGGFQPIQTTFDAGSQVLSSGAYALKTVAITGKIKWWLLLGNETGNLVLSVKKCNYSGFPTVSSITGGNDPSLAGTSKNSDATLSGWNVNVSAGDILEIKITGTPVSVKKAFFFLQIEP